MIKMSEVRTLNDLYKYGVGCFRVLIGGLFHPECVQEGCSEFIEKGEKIGETPETDRFRCHTDKSGISIIPKGGRKKKTRSK